MYRISEAFFSFMYLTFELCISKNWLLSCDVDLFEGFTATFYKIEGTPLWSIDSDFSLLISITGEATVEVLRMIWVWNGPGYALHIPIGTQRIVSHCLCCAGNHQGQRYKLSSNDLTFQWLETKWTKTMIYTSNIIVLSLGGRVRGESSEEQLRQEEE